jgi:hypothetical protein
MTQLFAWMPERMRELTTGPGLWPPGPRSLCAWVVPLRGTRDNVARQRGKQGGRGFFRRHGESRFFTGKTEAAV